MDNGLVADVDPGRFEDMVIAAQDDLPVELGRLMRNVTIYRWQAFVAAQRRLIWACPAGTGVLPSARAGGWVDRPPWSGVRPPG